MEISVELRDQRVDNQGKRFWQKREAPHPLQRMNLQAWARYQLFRPQLVVRRYEGQKNHAAGEYRLKAQCGGAQQHHKKTEDAKERSAMPGSRKLSRKKGTTPRVMWPSGANTCH